MSANVKQNKNQVSWGYYSLPKSVFDKLGDYDISVSKNERLYPWFITYDFESLMLKENRNSTRAISEVI